MSNPVTYPYSTWQPDAAGADSGHPVTQIDPMSAGSNNDAAGWVRLLESTMRYRSSVGGPWTEWLGINTPYSPSPAAPVYVAGNQFTLTGDWTSSSAGNYPAIALVGRRVKAYVTSNPTPVGMLGTITAASFSSPNTTVTVAWDNNASIDASLSEVQFAVVPVGSPFIALYKSNFQTINNTPAADVSLIINIGANERWGLRFTLYTNGTIGGGGNFVVAASGPGGAQFALGVNSSAVACATGGTASLTLAMTNNFWVVDLYVATASTPGNVTLTYASANITQILAGSNLIAHKLAGV